MVSRREVLASGLAFLSSGCTSLGFADQNDSDVTCEYEAEAGPFDPAVELPPDYSPARRALAVRAVRQGSATAFYGPRPLKNRSYVVVDDAFYEVSLVESYREELPALLLTVEWSPGREVPENATPYSFATLPEADQLALRSVVYGGVYRTQTHPAETLVHSSSPVTYPDGTDASEFATAGTVWVRWNGRAYRVTVHGKMQTETLVYEYAASEAATDAEAFDELIAERHLARLDELTPEERTILEEAIAGGFYKETQSCYSPYHRLRDRLPDRTVPESGGRWYVEYEGDRYGLDTSMVCRGTWCRDERDST